MVRIGEALTALGLISDGQLKDALDKQKTERTVPLGELLVKSGQLSRQDLQTALARKMGFPVVDVASFPIEADALRKVPFAMAKRLKVLPLLCRDETAEDFGLAIEAGDHDLQVLLSRDERHLSKVHFQQ